VALRRLEISQGGKSQPTEEELACSSACKG